MEQAQQQRLQDVVNPTCKVGQLIEHGPTSSLARVALAEYASIHHVEA